MESQLIVTHYGQGTAGHIVNLCLYPSNSYSAKLLFFLHCISCVSAYKQGCPRGYFPLRTASKIRTPHLMRKGGCTTD